MERYANVNKLVNELTDNPVLKTYYTLLLMGETTAEKDAEDERFWEKFDALEPDEQTVIRRAFQEAEKNLLTVAKNLNQKFTDYAASLESLKQVA